MNVNDYAAQLEQFDIASQKCGQPRPLRENLIPIVDEDAPDHTGKELCWPYVLHCAWAAKMLAKNKPQRHVDFGSYAYFAALCCSFVPKFEFYDIRGLGFDVPGLTAGKMDLTKIDLPDNSVESISCLHVIEHIGLGRYGDTIDPEGHLKAARELERILTPGGKLLLVLPMSENPKVCFNAHRLLSGQAFKDMFEELWIDEATFLHEKSFSEDMPEYGQEYTGCFELSK